MWAFDLLAASMSAALPALAFELLGVLAPRQVDDFGVDLGGDLFQFSPTNTGPKDTQVGALSSDDGEAWPACSLPYVATVAYENLAHETLL
jgi:hypothetical protein